MTERNPYHPDGLWPTAGSYTRTDEEDWKARAEKAEQALAEMTAHRDQCRDTAVKWQMEANRAVQPRPLAPEAITDEMVFRAQMEWGRRTGASPIGDTIRAILTAALTEPTRPGGAERWETWLSRLDYLHDETGASRADLATLANDLATEVRLTPTNPEEQS